MAAAIQSGQVVWDTVLEQTKLAQQRNTDPLTWAIQLSSVLSSAGASLPSIDLAHLLVDHVCWDNHVPIVWKFLEKALAVRLAPPLLVLALLSNRILPNRNRHPAAYRLYIELLRRHAFSLRSEVSDPNFQRTMKAVDEAVHLSQSFGLQGCEPGLLLLELVFTFMWQLVDASLDDEGLLEFMQEKKSMWLVSQEMDIDNAENLNEKRTMHNDVLCKTNTVMAIETVGEFVQNKLILRIIYLAQKNIPSHWSKFVQNTRLLVTKSMALRNSKHLTSDALRQLTSDKCRLFPKERMATVKHFNILIGSGSLISSAGQCYGSSPSALWLPIDLFLEDALDGSQVLAISAVASLTGLVKALQAINRCTWHDAFLGLWITALRLVQREREPSEGPVPRIDSCLSMLLSITTLAVASIIEEEESNLIEETELSTTNQRKENQSLGEHRKALVSSLQMLGDYEGLLTPPKSASAAANQAAAKAILFISELTVGKGYHESMSNNDKSVNCSGNLRHLMVEACIARNLLDTSAYLWPGYISARTNIPRGVPSQALGWSSLMKGSPLTPSLVNALVATPASSLAEIEKVYEIAISGSDDEKISAATILCGASLVRGWSIQEHAIFFITKLLSPPVGAENSGNHGNLIGKAAFLNVLLVGISSVDCLQIFSLHGLVPLLAGALMPICEVFGSLVPNISWTLPSGEELSPHAVFSNAFNLLLRLWRFDRPPFDSIGDVSASAVTSQQRPEYLLLVRNSQLASFGKSAKDRMKIQRLSKYISFSAEPILMDSFPKLEQWYIQHKKCICSTLSGLVQGTAVHQIVEALLSMMFRKINRGNQSYATSTSGSSSSSASGTEDVSIRLKVPAWDILEATPVVLDAALTACGHGRLSPREMATGLKDLADFLPATLPTIVSYFSAEVTRGIWKPADMNGTDWPSPAANLSTVEHQIKKILAGTGVDVPSLAAMQQPSCYQDTPIWMRELKNLICKSLFLVAGGSSPATLPLPLAALVSLTITYKLDKVSNRCLELIGPALNSLASSCPWPCMPIISSLWAQKVKRWSDFLIFSASNTVFHHSGDAVVQLLKSCFMSTLGLCPSHTSNGGVGALLGHGFGSHFSGGMAPVAPGILYLRVHRSVRDIMFMTEEILALLMSSVRDIAGSALLKLPREKLERLKKTRYGTRYGQVSLAAAMTRVKLAASLAASLVWISGGVSLVQALFKETLPSWFISVQTSGQDGVDSGGGVIAMLGGYALAYFTVLCGTFAWGVGSATPESQRRPKVLGSHLEFLASALDGKISLGCDYATWHAYVTGFMSLMVHCAPKWVLDLDVDILERLSKGLRQWSEGDLALALLVLGGARTCGSAVELIMETDGSSSGSF